LITSIDTGDTAWVLLSAALAFLMVPGFAFFYGSMIRNKNTLSIFTPCFVVVCWVSLQWILFGYSLSFGPDHNGWIGTLASAGLRGVGAEPNLEYAGTIPQQAFMIFHAMTAVIATAILMVAFAERIKLRSLCTFALLWTTMVYDPVAHWVWGAGGFLRSSGVLDFAGGTVVHLSVGASVLATALVLGKSSDSPPSLSPSPIQPFAILGAGMLWFGWFGFNAGNALSSGALAASVFVATHTAAAAAGLTWFALEGVFNKAATLLGLLTGVIVGLVAITPAAGFVGVGGALGIGVGASVICYASLVFIKKKFGYSDSLIPFGIHGIGGTWGILATGLWAAKSVNPLGADGLLYGNPDQLFIQIKAVLAIAFYSFGMSYLLLKIVDYIVGLPSSDKAFSASV
jgi:Amt family ammonium transporter